MGFMPLCIVFICDLFACGLFRDWLFLYEDCGWGGRYVVCCWDGWYKICCWCGWAGGACIVDFSAEDAFVGDASAYTGGACTKGTCAENASFARGFCIGSICIESTYAKNAWIGSAGNRNTGAGSTCVKGTWIESACTGDAYTRDTCVSGPGIVECSDIHLQLSWISEIRWYDTGLNIQVETNSIESAYVGGAYVYSTSAKSIFAVEAVKQSEIYLESYWISEVRLFGTN